MFNNHFSGISIPKIESASMLVFWLIVVNLGFNVLSNAAFPRFSDQPKLARPPDLASGRQPGWLRHGHHPDVDA